MLFESNANYRSRDGVNILLSSAKPAYLKGEVMRIAIRWNNLTLKWQIGYLRKSIYGATWQWGTETAFDGGILSGTLIELALGNTVPMTFRNLPVIYDYDMTTAAIEAKF